MTPFRAISGIPTLGAAAYWTLERVRDGRRAALVVPKLADVEELQEALEALSALFPGVDASAAVATEDPASLPPALDRLLRGAPVAILQSSFLDAALPEPREYAASRLELRLGARLGRAELVSRLETLGYRREDFADTPGDYAVRGSVTDFCLPSGPSARAGDGSGSNIRIYWHEEAVESIREFDPATQRTSAILEAVELPPLKPAGSRRAADWLGGFDWLGLGPEPSEGLPEGALLAQPSGEDWGARSNPRFQGNLELAARQVREWLGRGWRVFLYSLNRGEDERLRESVLEKLAGPGEPASGVEFLIGPLTKGFNRPDDKLAILTSGEIYERSYRARARWADVKPQARAKWRELKSGDYVVHSDYGVARYQGLRPVTAPPPPGLSASQRALEPSPVQQELILLEFRGADRLFVPLWEFRKVQKYVGATSRAPRLSSIDTRSWERTRDKVREGVRELAEELLRIEAERALRSGAPLGPETHLEREFADSFPYEETSDQRRALSEVLADLEKPSPMNRLVIGDVGFGKTEVAMRAALKCAVAGRQAAVLVPTTILADQHRRNFERRFADYPVRIAGLSRFQTPAEQKAVLEALAKGAIDVVIGTHRLLQKDVRFGRLGLVVVDEEHRFGVRDKEKLKKLAAECHVLALSATPIPRSLYQSLSGLRELSLIASPPAGRLPIVTRVAAYSEEAVASAIRQELERGGQAYYVYNRVRGLAERTRELEKLLPGVRFGMAHGQLKAADLEKTMWDFFSRRFDALVSSTIIESGLDIPTVNTLIVEDAHQFGLGQLYQLRGRIGRENARAYCLLLYPAGPLTAEARERLEALQEFAHLGSGFHLAMRDLEIRGAGELLGPRQHGFVTSIGLESYCELLKDEIESLRGRKSRQAEASPVTLDLKLPAFVPAEYVPDEMLRLETYKRILASGPAELDAIRAELSDVSGPPPPQVENLLRLARLKAEAERSGVRSVLERDGTIDVLFQSGAVPPYAVARWAREYGGRLSFFTSELGDGLRLRLEKRSAAEEVEAFLSSFRRK